MLNHRKKDPEVEAENARNDAEYGYDVKKAKDYYPLLEEITIDKKEMTYADEILGKWVKQDKGLDDFSGIAFGLFIKQQAEKNRGSETVTPQETGFEDIDDKDPYYYLYEEEATGKKKRTFGDLDKAKLYEEKYGSIFRIFSEASQEEIIEAPVNQFSFVNAGPGTGKTYTLIEKIKYMLSSQDENNELVNPEGILVLCFTNAAVNEIKDRIKKYAEEKGDRTFINIDVRTFHSFSWLLISQANEIFYDRPNYKYIDISTLNYDQSIRKATEIIHKFGDEVFGGCEHLIVDEIQDLTNERASLVLAMVQECIKNQVGITVLGDSCQAIYDYSDDETVFELKSDRFYKYMFAEFYDCGKFYKLEKNHRQSEWLINATIPLRKAILEGKKNTVREVIAKLKMNVPVVTTGQFSVKISSAELKHMTENATLCLMCRNNAQVLATSTNLRKRGIKHIVNAYNEFEYLSDWIGKALGLFTKEIITFDEFVKLINKYDIAIDMETVWERLQDLIGSQNNVLQIAEILKVAAKSKVDDPIFRNVPHGNLVVSNIHKSKGREYDNVIVEQKFVNRLINESTLFKSVPEYLEEAKILYVAVTRPKTKLYFNSLASTDVSFKKIKTGRKRWVRGDGSNLKRVEIRALSDADIQTFNNIDIQEYIFENVSEGDDVKLVLDSNSQSVSYNIVHTSEKGDRVIGKVSSEFIEDIDAIITPYNSPWPRRFTDLYVSGIHSNISNTFDKVWCWVDFCGLGAAHNDVY